MPSAAQRVLAQGRTTKKIKGPPTDVTPMRPLTAHGSEAKKVLPVAAGPSGRRFSPKRSALSRLGFEIGKTRDLVRIKAAGNWPARRAWPVNGAKRLKHADLLVVALFAALSKRSAG